LPRLVHSARRLFWLALLFALAACGGSPAAPPTNPPAASTAETAAEAETETASDNGGTPAGSAEINLSPTSAQEQAALALPTPVLANPTAVSVPGTLPLNAEGLQVVARVNDSDITLPQLERAVARYQQLQFQATDPTALQGTVLDILIEQALIEQAAAAQNVQVTDAEVEAELQTYAQAAGSPEAWQQWLTSNLYLSEDEFRQDLRQNLLTNRIRDAVTAPVTGTVPQVRARHILVATEAEANTVLQRLSAGEDFAALAAQFSRDETTRSAGGDLGWFAREELLEPRLAEIAFSLDVGESAGPVVTSLGYHIIQTLEKGERTVPEERRANLAQNQFELWLASARQNATIERFI
jgi:foldase protein PrsA